MHPHHLRRLPMIPTRMSQVAEEAEVVVAAVSTDNTRSNVENLEAVVAHQAAAVVPVAAVVVEVAVPPVARPPQARHQEARLIVLEMLLQSPKIAGHWRSAYGTFLLVAATLLSRMAFSMSIKSMGKSRG